jgi:very-short-patch-repair endonuclease
VGFRDKVVFDIAAEPNPHYHEAAIIGLEGITLAVEDDVWMQVKRLRETQPPDCDPMFAGWVKDGPHPTPDKQPVLAESRMLRLPIEEVSDLAEAGLIDLDDVMRPRDEDDEFPNTMDVILRPSRMREFRDAWREYIDVSWAKWAEVEKPRRRSIRFYNALYLIHQRVTAAGEDSATELIWGIGVARWKHELGVINVPILEQQVELDLRDDGTILFSPRQVPPLLALKAFHSLDIQGSKTLQREASDKLARIVNDPDLVFSPFERRAFEPLLRSAAAQLSPTGSYAPDEDGYSADDRGVKPVDIALRITDTWVIFARPRGDDFRKEDIQKLIRQIEKTDNVQQLPPAGIRFVREPSDELPSTDSFFDLDGKELRVAAKPSAWGGGGFGGGYSGGNGGGGREKKTPDRPAFFPLAYNEDQREILRRLDESEGVLVQGPPGTGKTHTIANVICHYMATGKRILVTAKTAEALTALHDKLPEGIRDLAISVIHNDRQGARQLEQAIEILANSAKQINEREVEREIIDRQNQLANSHDRIVAIDAELLVYAKKNLEPVENSGGRHLPMDLAQRVVSERVRHLWFEDILNIDERFQPSFTDGDINAAGRARAALGSEIIYSLSDLPDPAALPDVARVLGAHVELARDKAIDEKSRTGALPYMAVVAIDMVRSVHGWLADLHGFFEEVGTEVWIVTTYQTLCGFRKSDETAVVALRRALEQWSDIYRNGRDLTLRGIDHGDVALDNAAFDAAIGKLSRGEKPFGVFSFNGQLKASIANVTVGGVAPSSPEDWREVMRFRAWQREAQIFLRQWSSLASTIGLPPIAVDWSTGRGELMRVGRSIAALLAFAADAAVRVKELQTLFPHGLDARAVVYEGQIAVALEALSVNLEKTELANAHLMREQIEDIGGGKSLPFHAAVADIGKALGDASVPTHDIADGWKQICAEANRLSLLRPQRQLLDEVAKKVAQSGAPAWASKLSIDPFLGGIDQWTPPDWRESWEWSRASGFISGLSDRKTVAKLSAERAEQEILQRRLLSDVVRLRTFLGLKKRMTDRIQTALAKFASAVARLGAGTGLAAARHRRIIRDATLDAAVAVPCWILPEWRVSEQLPAELAAFDLVIIDEASQSDVTALPAILRGKKLLVVGDDKQVSPVHIGLDERTIVQLRTTYLTGLPFADQMDPATSLYELGGMLFPGKAILLREHFRCVEPIIRFSSRFYQNLLVPMRLPTASERLDPPLIDIFVRDGIKTGDINLREAEVIVEEIRLLTENPEFEGRTIGVISMIGDKQAKLIYDHLMRDLGAEVMERHRIRCGNASNFQGQECNIVFLSMMACPKTASAQRSRMYEQRFNVAMSRARDRLVLVRSVTSSDLKPGDLKLQVIEHFRNPMGGGQVASRKDILEACGSGFERDFGAKLIELGYRLRAQVPVAGYFIDFVVEGANDSRLAIELDGDKWHGPDRWAADFQRQSALERLGWKFWRCWGSSWVADREGCLADLLRTFATLGIEPLGADAVEGSWTAFRETGSPEEAVVANDELVQPAPANEETVETSLDKAEAPSAAPQPVDDTSVFPDEPVDLVVVRYEDEPSRAVRVRISRTEHKPDVGIIHAREPLAVALLGCPEGEEIEVKIGTKTRVAVIEMIERDQVMAA